ncbi:MAG: penicillin-binding protein 2 [Rhodoluna sp.]|nr:penicillin-binding protein 2 [Rhodoluna sp.]
MTILTPGDPRKRRRLFTASIAVFAFFLVFRLFAYQVVDAAEINKVSKESRSKTRTIQALRGDIIDANGNVLAHSVYTYDINAAPKNVGPIIAVRNGQEVSLTVDQQAAEIARILHATKEEILSKISGNGVYSNLAKGVSAAQYRALQRLQLPWLYYDPILSRTYAEGATTGGVVGFVGVDGLPLAGIERQMNSCLAGVDGQETYQRGVDGIRIPSSAVVSQRAENGRTVQLTINKDLQYLAQNQLYSEVQRYRADWATAIVVEVKTGKILVAAEAPSVDSNDFGVATDDSRKSRIFETSFEPGSTMKTITAATLIDTGRGTPTTKTVAPYSMKIPGRIVSDSHHHPTEHLTLTGVLKDSSNTGIINIGQVIPRQVRYDYMKKFGFGVKTSVNFPGEGSGILRPASLWDGTTDKVSMFGQGVAVTPIQMAMAYQAIANKGVRLQPIIVDGCRDANGNLTPVPVGAPTRVISESTATQTLAMLEKVVEFGGIGKTASLSEWRVGGKSGTAQISNDNGVGYGYLHAVSFIGMAPIEDPKYVVAVTFFKPRTVSTSLGATPSFRYIMKKALLMGGVPPSTTKSKPIPLDW